MIVSRTRGKNLVVMSLEEYNSIQETLYITGTKAKRKRLDDTLKELNKANLSAVK